MRGKHRIIVSTKRLRYDFEVRRNLTIIKGDSATGKTTLVDMIRDYVNNPSGSPVNLSCDKSCYVLEGTLWKEQLAGIADGIVFIDEGNEFIRTAEFAGEIQKTDNYYVIVTREALPALPYSVEEIYGIRTSGKYGTLKQSYHEFYRLYGENASFGKMSVSTVITEDSNSGYQFFSALCQKNGIACESMNGKSNVFHYLNAHKEEQILIIADGAAFGSEMERVLQLIRHGRKAMLYLPESFEWLILSSGILKKAPVEKILEEPSDYVESREYFSWERFFTALLIDETKNSYLAYAKRTLNPQYLTAANQQLILSRMGKPGECFVCTETG